MSPLAALLWAKRRIARHTLASVKRESRLKVAFVSISAFLLWLGLFGAARLVFRFLETIGSEVLGGAGATTSVSDLVMARLLSVFALTLLSLLTISNLLVAFAALYRSRDLPMLLTAPLPVSTFFLGRFVEIVTTSSWASGYLGSPLLLAYGIETGAPLVFYLAAIAFAVPFVALPAAVGATVTIAAVPVFARLSRRAVVATAIGLVVGLWALFRQRLRLPDFGDAGSVQAVVDAIGRAQSPFLPSQWLARGVLDAAGGDVGSAVFHFLLLAANALLATGIAVLAAERWHARGWSALRGRAEGAGPAAASGGGFGGLDLLLRPLSPPTRALVAKDVRVFWRDPAQWSQFVILFGVLAVYVANLGSRPQSASEGMWRALVTLLNVGASLLVLASLTTRFVYPLVSLEGRRFWLIGLAPLERGRIVWQKLGLSVVSTALFTVGLAVVSGLRLGLPPLPFVLSIAGVAAATFGLSGLAVGLGSLYPNFQEESPSRIVSGMGGTLNFMLSLVYVALIMAAQAAVLLWYRLEPVLGTDAFVWVAGGAAVWTLALTLAATVVPLRLGLRHLEQLEL